MQIRQQGRNYWKKQFFVENGASLSRYRVNHQSKWMPISYAELESLAETKYFCACTRIGK